MDGASAARSSISSIKLVIMALLFVAVQLVISMAFNGGTAFANSHNNNNGDHKVTICHRTNSNVNPYNQISVDKNAAGRGQDAGDHADKHQGPVWNPTLKDQKIKWGDIIPSYDNFAGLNWTTKGQEIYQNNCNPPEPAANPVKPSMTTQVSAHRLLVGDTVMDTAVLDGTNGEVTGGIKFFLCGPAATFPDCSTGGVMVDRERLNSEVATSDPYRVTATGKYCFRAEYVPDRSSNYQNTSHTNKTTECFRASLSQQPSDDSSIRIIKDAQPDSNQSFRYETNFTGSFRLTDNGTSNGQEDRTFRGLQPNESYRFREQAVNGWNLSDINCNSGDWHINQNGALVVRPASNERITCTFTNVKEQSPGPNLASVTIVKDSRPDSSQTFNFTTNLELNGSLVSNFSLTDDDSSSASKTFTGLAAGSYTVTETDVEGWQLEAINCSPGAQFQLIGNQLVLEVTAGSSITCTFVNVEDDENGQVLGDQAPGGRGAGEVLGTGTVTVISGGQGAGLRLVNTGTSDASVWSSLIAGLSLIGVAAGVTWLGRRQTKELA